MRILPSYNDRMVSMALSCDCLFFQAVSAMEFVETDHRGLAEHVPQLPDRGNRRCG